MNNADQIEKKARFHELLSELAEALNKHVSTEDGHWTIKGFIDVFRNIYTISSDTKIVSKILELHLFPLLLQFGDNHGYVLVPATHQNYYPDISFLSRDDPNIKFAVDFKTTYRLSSNPEYCNGFTLGSHGEYFINRESTKNIQFPYSSYLGHFCLGIIYTRADRFDIDETRVFALEELHSITSVIKDFRFFVAEKWRIASDRSGSGNTANIGSIQYIPDILTGRGMFSNLGEEWFDDYWMNYGKITVSQGGHTRNISNLRDFVMFRNGDTNLIVSRERVRRRSSTGDK